MRVESGPNSFVIKAAKSILVFDLSLVCLVVGMIWASPIIVAIKLFFIMLVIIYGAVTINDFRRSKPNTLIYSPQTHRWLYNQQPVSLQSQQFLTVSLVILYLLSVDQKKISLVIPADSMPKDQHIRLRKLIIAWSKTANRS
ncbi:hypothetical protein N9I32_04505 [Porticoccaceae bacterium]|nr:hypothetical protein [Porticoccaceae bacterium]